MLKLSVVILSYNVRHFLELCLDSVELALRGIPSEIIVVDNQSSDDSCSFVKQNFPHVKLIKNQINYGFSKGNNIGVSQAKGELICLLNPDTFVAEDTFSQLLDYAERISNFGIIGPRLIDGSGRFLPESKRGVPSPRTAFFKLLGINRLFPKSSFFNAYYAPFLRENEAGEVPILVGACMLIKKKNYQELGGLDEQFFMYGEDIDLSYRLIKLGFQNFYAGTLSVVHFKGESTLKDQKYFRRFSKAMQLFYRKHFGRNLFLNFFYASGSLVLSGLKVFDGLSKIKKATAYQMIFLMGSNDEKVRQLQNVFPGCRIVPIEHHAFLEATNRLNRNGSPGLMVFDCGTSSYKVMMQMMMALKDSHVKFAFLPKSSTFILKSETSKTRGNVVKFMN